MTDRPGHAGEPSAQLRWIADEARRSMHTMEELACDFVREAILQGLYRPGQRLPQEAIAELLDMSRLPVRTSLRRLETEGLVVFHPYRGATVRVLTAPEIAEIYQIRVLVETHLLELAAAALTPSALVELQTVADSVHDAGSRGRTWIEDRVGFYDRLYSQAERPRMAALVRGLRREVGPYLLIRDASGAEVHPYHLEVLAFLRAGDVEGAARMLAEHLAEVSEQLQRLVEALPAEG